MWPMTSSKHDGRELVAKGALLLDVRTVDEYRRGHVKGALHLPLHDLRAHWQSLPRDRPIFVTCQSGFRAHLATRILLERGFARVKNVTGGHLAVEAEGGFPLERA